MAIFETLAGVMPDHHTSAFLEWAERIESVLRAMLAASASAAYDTTIYWDPELGDDLNSGETENDPVQTEVAVRNIIDGTSGTIRLRLRRGRDYHSMSGVTWTTDHYTVILIDGRDCRIDLYGDVENISTYFHAALPMVGGGLSNWVKDGSNPSYYYDLTGHFPSGISTPASTVDRVYYHNTTEESGQGSVSTLLTRQTSLANCNATPGSFYWDAGNQWVYVHTATSSNPGDDYWAVPSNILSMFRIENCNGYVDLSGGWLQAYDAEGYGFGHALNDTNSHAYFISSGATGSNLVIAANFLTAYGSAHGTASWGSFEINGGSTVFIGARCRRSIDHSGGNNFINFYAYSANNEGLAIDCHVLSPTIINNNWGKTIGGHTSGGTTGIVGAIRCSNLGGTCFASSDAQGTGNTPSTFKNFALDCVEGSYASPATNMGSAGKTSYINATVYIGGDPGVTNTGFVNIGTSNIFSGIHINPIWYIVYNGPSEANGHGITYGSGAQDMILEHPLVVLDNRNVNTGARGLGIHSNCTHAGTNTIATQPVSRGLFVRSEDNVEVVCPGWRNGTVAGDADPYMIDNAYYGMSNSPDILREQAGYNNVTNPVELVSSPISETAGVYTPVDYSITDSPGLIEYDRNKNRRGVEQTARGPWEHPDLIPVVHFLSRSISRSLSRLRSRFVGRG
jgi:hypothetical protein